MDNIYSVIDLAKLGLDIEKLKVKVAAENIANVSNPTYIRQDVDFEKIISAVNAVRSGDVVDSDALDSMRMPDKMAGNIVNLDQEVLNITDSEMRFKVIAQAVQKKIGLFELAMNGGKK